MNYVDPHQIITPQRDRFGCCIDALDEIEPLFGGGIRFHRKRSAAKVNQQVIAPPSNDGYLVGISMLGGHKRRIFGEYQSTEYDFAENSMYIRESSDRYKADLTGNFDFILMEVSKPAFEQIVDGADLQVTDLSRLIAHSDPALGALATALFAPGGAVSEKSFLFIDQLSVAIGIHLLTRYGNGPVVSNDRVYSLSRRDVDRVKQLLLSKIDGQLSVDELAIECNLSRAAFLRAFRRTIGRTPHQWLMQQRIELASKLLRGTDQTIGEIAVACGFSGPSHFSRAFLSATGTTPSLWRRG